MNETQAEKNKARRRRVAMFQDARARVDVRYKGAGAIQDLVGRRQYRALVAEELLALAAVQSENPELAAAVVSEGLNWLNRTMPL